MTYLVFDERHFLDDLQFEDAVPMLDRLMMDLAAAQGRAFGVKLSTPSPWTSSGELPSRGDVPLRQGPHPLALALAERLGQASGRLPISFSGG